MIIVALIYVGIAVFIRERLHRKNPSKKRFSVVNGLFTSIAGGGFIGVWPGILLLVLNFTSMSGTGPGDSYSEVGIAVAVLGGLGCAALGGYLAFKFRRVFKENVFAYYISILITCIPIVSLVYITGDYLTFYLTHE